VSADTSQPQFDTTPLLLINGWTCSQNNWGSLFTNGLYKVPRFTGGRQVIAFDNRGVGKSSTTEGPYSVGQLSEDAAELLAALGVSSAHVLGVSMGGMVAQQLAVDKPELVSSLVIGSSTAGGRKMTAADKGFARSFFGSFRKWDENDRQARLAGARSFISGCVAPRNKLANHASVVDRLAMSYEWADKRGIDGINAQLGALGTFKGVPLESISQPALIVHGTHDQVLPYGNAETLATELPAARLLPLHGQGHLWNLTQESAVRTIDQFLVDVDAGALAESYSVEPYADGYN
jgi:pimeloyl-ACP methyl ester carboxylesterase